jgi:mycoredoxin
MLRLGLRRSRLPVEEINIWEDRAAAAAVRAITGGDETVPTVVVGTKAMVNPSARQVIAAVRAELPGFIPQRALSRHPGSPGWLACSPAVGPGRSLPPMGAANPRHPDHNRREGRSRRVRARSSRPPGGPADRDGGMVRG